jgi:hypothetical protein
MLWHYSGIVQPELMHRQANVKMLTIGQANNHFHYWFVVSNDKKHKIERKRLFYSGRLFL